MSGLAFAARLIVESEAHRPRLIGAVFPSRPSALGLHGVELGAGLLAIADRIVGAEGICFPPGSRNSLQHFIRFFWLKVQGSMKSCSMIMKMTSTDPSRSAPSGRPQAWQEKTNSSATFSDPATADDDHRPFQRPLDLRAEIGHDAIRDVVEIIVDIEEARERRDLVAIDEGVGDRIAGGKAARHGNEIAVFETCPRSALRSGR